MRLKDKVALITGGAVGIGKATAARFIQEGARVIICDVNEPGGKATANELGDNCTFTAVDISDRQTVYKWIGKVIADFGRINIFFYDYAFLKDITCGTINGKC